MSFDLPRVDGIENACIKLSIRKQLEEMEEHLDDESHLDRHELIAKRKQIYENIASAVKRLLKDAAVHADLFDITVSYMRAAAPVYTMGGHPGEGRFRKCLCNADLGKS